MNKFKCDRSFVMRDFSDFSISDGGRSSMSDSDSSRSLTSPILEASIFGNYPWCSLSLKSIQRLMACYSVPHVLIEKK